VEVEVVLQDEATTEADDLADQRVGAGAENVESVDHNVSQRVIAGFPARHPCIIATASISSAAGRAAASTGRRGHSTLLPLSERIGTVKDLRGSG
jgi:hypothetical protein